MARHDIPITGDHTVYSEVLRSEDRIKEFLAFGTFEAHLLRFLKIAETQNRKLIIKIQIMPKDALDD